MSRSSTAMARSLSITRINPFQPCHTMSLACGQGKDDGIKKVNKWYNHNIVIGLPPPSVSYNNAIDDQPVSHEGHGLCGLPERLDDSGVADDHDDAGDQECDDQLVESEVDPKMEDDASHDYIL